MGKCLFVYLPWYVLGRHGWLCTYHIWVIWVCRTSLIVYLSYTIMDKCFDSLLPVYELERHGWQCTYHIWVIRVCRARLMVYSSHRIRERYLIVYCPCMSLDDMVDSAHTIYEWYEFVGYGWLYTYRIKLWGTIWLFTYRMWAWKAWLIVHLPYLSDIDL